MLYYIIDLQLCDVTFGHFPRKPSSMMVRLIRDEVTLSVRNSEGWNITFDRTPPMVGFIVLQEQLKKWLVHVL